jgi:hypothetical protein
MRNPTLLSLLLAGGALVGCDATSPTGVTRVDVGAVTPTRGTLQVPRTYPYIIPGGVLLPKGSGLISVAVTMTTPRETPARLNVYLLTGPDPSRDYCGQNSPDSPVWTALPRGTTRFEVTGFRVSRLPCVVTGVRVMVHTRPDNGLLIPPTPGETLAETTVPVSYEIRQD